MFNIKIMFQETPVRHEKEQGKKGKKKSECLSSLPRQIHRIHDTDLSRIREEIKHIVHDDPSITVDKAIMRAIRYCKLPVCLEGVKKRVDLTGIPFIKQKKIPFSISDESLKEGIALVAGGASISIAAIALEIGHCEFRGKRAKALLEELTEEDIRAAKEKYKDVLEQFGIYNRIRMRYDMDELRRSIDGSCKIRYRTVDGSGLKYEPKLIAKFVKLYSKATELGFKGWARIRYVKTASHTALHSETINKLIFSHDKYPGCEDIPTPKHRQWKPRPITEQTRLQVLEVKYLRDEKNLSRTAVTKVTRFKGTLIDDTYHNRWYTSIVMQPEVKQMLDEKYKDLKPVKKGHAGILAGNQYELRLAQEIIYLRDIIKYDISRIKMVLGLDPRFIRQVYSKKLHTNLQISPDMRVIFNQRYGKA